MRRTITISLPDELQRQVDQLAAEEGSSRSEIVRLSLADYLYFRQLRRIRDRMRSRAEATGVFTDEDVFGRVS